MRNPGLILAALALIACDTKKLGVEGSTCSASSDCADDLQCMQSTCVRPQAANTSVRPAQPATAPPTPVPAVSPATPAPVAQPVPAVTPAAPVPAAPPVPAPPADPPAAPQAPGTTLSTPHLPGLGRPADAASGPPPATPTAPAADPGFSFADPASWPVIDKAKDPWAVAILTALRGIRVGSYAAQSAPMTYKFQLKVCPDGRMTANRKGGDAEPQVMGVIENTIEALPPIAPPPVIRGQLAGSCKKIPYVFTMKLRNGKTEVE